MSAAKPFTAKPFTGRRMAAILVAFFGVVVAVNIGMATMARTTFGGVTVTNSYVASQQFNGWLDAARQSERLGWQSAIARLPDGRVDVRLTGAPADAVLKATARHPLGRKADVDMAFVSLGQGAYRSTASLPKGRWTLRMEARAGADLWRAEQNLP